MASLMTVVGTVNGEYRPYENAQSGNRSLSFTVQDYFTKKDRETGEKTYFNLNYDVQLYGTDVTNAEQYFKDGSAIIIMGDFKGKRDWESQDGSKRGTNYVLGNCKLVFPSRDKQPNRQGNSSTRRNVDEGEEMDLGS